MANKITLEGLVCENRVSEAITELKSLIDTLSKEYGDSLTQLSSRIQSVSKQIDENTAPAESTNIENSRIRAAFLHILTDVREEIQSKVNFFKPIPRAAKDRDMLRDFIHTVLSKKYTEIAPFSEGNSFIYFSAREIHSEQDVMIMVLKSSDIEEFSKSRQLQMISRLKHRNLIQLMGVNFHSYPFYIITEFVSGISLKKLLSTTGAFPFHNAKRLLLIIGDVANYLRQKRFAHSGIRPSKIIIDEELEPEISPFDILRVSESKRLAISLLEDSYYFAPEILHVHDTKDLSTVEIDRANQFCLAALGFEMITGEKLFLGKNLSEVLLNRHTFFTDAGYRKARFSHPRLPSRMASILKKMLQEKPEKRYDYLLSALNKISRVKSVTDKTEELLFSSYRRCLGYSDNFIAIFYENLFSEPGLEMVKPEDQTDKQKLYQNFYRTIHLFFDIENAVLFMNRLARISSRTTATVEKYKVFLNVFVDTISKCDPRWDYRPEIKKAWYELKTRIFETLDAQLNEDTDTGSIKAELQEEPETKIAEGVGDEWTFPSEEEKPMVDIVPSAPVGEMPIDPEYDPEKA